MHKKHIIALILSLALVGCGAESSPEEVALQDTENQKETRIEAKKAEVLIFGAWSPDTERTVLGRVQAASDVTIVAEAAGTVKNIRVKLGDDVRKGQTLLNLEEKNNQSQVQYLTAQQNYNATKASTQSNIQSAKTQLETTKATMAESIRQAEVALQNAENTTASNIQSAEIALENAIKQQNTTEDAEAESLRAQYVDLRNLADSARTTANLMADWLDTVYLVTERYRTREVDLAKRQIGENARVEKSMLTTMAGQFVRRGDYIPHDESDAEIRTHASFRQTELESARILIRSTDSLIRNTGVNAQFSDADRTRLSAETNGYIAQLDGLIRQLETTQKNISAAEERSTQTTTGSGNAVAQAEASLQSAKDAAAAQIASAKAAIDNAKEQAEAAIKQAEAGVESAQSGAKLQLANANSQVQISQIGQSDLQVISLLTGQISEILVDPYTQVQPGTPLFRVTQNGKNPVVTATLTVEETQAIQQQNTVTVRFNNGQERNIERIQVAERVDPVTQKMIVDIPLKRLPKDVNTGELVHIIIPIAQGTNGVLPLSAVSFEPNGGEVLIINDNAEAERRSVQIGDIRGDSVEVTQGLRGGDMVVRYRSRVRSGDVIDPTRS